MLLSQRLGQLILGVIPASLYWLALEYPGENYLGDRWSALTLDDEVHVNLTGFAVSIAAAFLIGLMAEIFGVSRFLPPEVSLTLMIIGLIPNGGGVVECIGVGGAMFYVPSMLRSNTSNPTD